ncbi:MAG: T9SS type A sorting domain-containing protein [Bacteroidales bacterium]|nr:T9SS type A sorting domain-containing protein [Bacteroidales bacterium]
MQLKDNVNKTIITILLISLCSLIFKNNIYSQVPTIFAKEPVISKSGVYNSQKMDSVITPFVNKDSLLNSEENNNCETFKFGYAIDVAYNINSGSWDKTKANGKVWKLKIISKGAYSINLIFDKLVLPKDASLYIYNEKRTMVYGPITSEHCQVSGMFASDIINGESIILEYFVPHTALKEGQINISKVIHGYKDIFKTSDNEKEYGESGDCEIDINCPEGDDWCVESRTVAMILKNENTEWCTGAMINNVKEDFTPYFLTANHCLGDGFNPNTALFRFHYKNPTCNATSYYGTYWTFTGSSLRANASISDFALLELNNYNVNDNIDKIAGIHFAGWNRNNLPPLSGAGIHHPKGDAMKISLYGNTVVNSFINNVYVYSWLLNFDDGIVEKGSSGSPLFNQNHLIVGQLYGTTDDNYITCKNQDGDAVYGRFDISRNNGLKAWLDPENTGIIEVDAISPPIIYHNRMISGGPYLYTATHEMELAGNISGYPNMPPNWPTNVWPFPENDQAFVVEQGANVEFKAGERIVIKPGTHIKQGASARGYIAPVTCSDGLDYHRSLYKTNNNGNVSCLHKTSENDTSLENYQKSGKEKEETSAQATKFSSYPNPFTTSTTITFSIQQPSQVNIYITNSYGQKVHKVYNNFTDAGNYEIRLDGSVFQPGLYFCIMETQSSREMMKIVKM